jgi:hypothetical protein
MKIEGLEYFVGKVCTVFTVPTNRDFKSENPQTFPQPVFHYFVGKVLEVTPRGIAMEQWNSEKKLRSFFFMDHVVSISEEEILDPSNPKDLKIIEDFKKTNETSLKKANQNLEGLKSQRESMKGNFLDIESLTGLVSQAKAKETSN